MRNQRSSLWLGVAIFGVLALPALWGQVSRPAETGIATDWSHHHLIFSRPATAEQARRVEQDPRYWQQRDRSQLRKPPAVAESRAALPSALRLQDVGGGMPRPPRRMARGDWSENLGSNINIGAANYPAKYSFALTTANCASADQPDFVVYSTELPGSGTQASVVAYDNLYAGCTGTVPTVYWAYNTGTNAKILTSPAFSRDGKQVAFVQTNATGSSLVLLKWAPSATETVVTPDAPTAVLPGAYRSCIAPCMTTIQLTTSLNVPTTDSGSSVFLDLSNDTAWVGDDLGLVHKFTPVFLGANPPAEVTTGGFPAQMTAGSPLTSAIHDFSSGNVYVGDTSGFLYAVDSSTGAVTQSGQLDFGVGITGGPVVDSTAGLVYVFSSADGTGGCTGGADCTAVWLLSTNFAPGDVGQEEQVGTSVIEGSEFPPSPLYIGAFDSTYENSITATGNLYVCGNTGGSPTLYQVQISNGSFGTVNTGPELSNAAPSCSPVSDIYNPNATAGPSEFFFVSTPEDGVSSGCSSGGCIYNFNDTPWKPNNAYAVGQEVVDTHFQVQVVTRAGTSGPGPTPPGWTRALGGITNDGGIVLWLNQGVTSSATPGDWQATTLFNKGTKILDSHGNIELATTRGTSSGTVPVWPSAAGGTVVDGTVRWINAGAIATSALAESDGTSGIIVDNTVGSGTIVGGSQIYFFTLGNQTCGTSGGGRCAVQVSQSALQ